MLLPGCLVTNAQGRHAAAFDMESKTHDLSTPCYCIITPCHKVQVFRVPQEKVTKCTTLRSAGQFGNVKVNFSYCVGLPETEQPENVADDAECTRNRRQTKYPVRTVD